MKIPDKVRFLDVLMEELRNTKIFMCCQVSKIVICQKLSEILEELRRRKDYRFNDVKQTFLTNQEISVEIVRVIIYFLLSLYSVMDIFNLKLFSKELLLLSVSKKNLSYICFFFMACLLLCIQTLKTCLFTPT